MKACFSLFVILLHLSYLGLGQTDITQEKYVSAFVDQTESNDFIEFNDSSTSTLNTSAIQEAIRLEFSDLNPLSVLKPKLNDLRKILTLTKSDFNQDLNMDKSRLQRMKENSSIGGQIEVESFTSNQNLPYSLNEAQYTRLRATPRLTLLGLPFTTDIYLTTEDNSYFNSNSFTLDFDLDAYKESLKENLNEVYEGKKEDLYRLADMEEDIETYKKDVERKINELKVRAIAEKDKQQRELIAKANEKKYDLEKTVRDSVNGIKSAVTDSLTSHTDSLRSSVENIEHKKDSFLQEYEKRNAEIQQKIAHLQTYIEKADSIKKVVNNSKEVVTFIITKEKQSLLKKAESQKGKFLTKTKDSVMHSKPIQQFIATIEDFQIGLCNPYFSNNSLNGIPIKGINAKRVSPSKTAYYRLAFGNSVASFNPFDRASRKENLYSRRVLAAKTGYGEEDYNDLYFISMTVWDPIKSDSNNQVNSVSSVGFNFALNKVQMKSEMSHAYYKTRNNGAVITETYSPENIIRNSFSSLALVTEVKYKISKKNKVKFKYDQKNQNFRSLGSPFLRNNYRSIDFTSNNNLLKNKLSISGFYKYFEDNVSNLSENTNTMKGFGATLQTNFKKYPNVLISYTPFEQSNNHQDSLLRTNNKFRSLNSQLSYSKSIDKHFIQTFINHNLALIEYEESGFTPSNTSILSFNQAYQNDKLNANLGYTASRTMPSIDSLSFNAFNMNVAYQFKFGSIGSTILHKKTLAKGQQSSQLLFVETKILKNINFKITTGHRYLNNIWGLKDTHIFYGMVSLGYDL